MFQAHVRHLNQTMEIKDQMETVSTDHQMVNKIISVDKKDIVKPVHPQNNKNKMMSVNFVT